MAEALLTTLDAQRLIRASGADAQSFLQGQLSSDLRKLSADLGQISSYSTPKGRMLAVLCLRRLDDGIALELHESVAEATLARLRKFVMRSKVTLELLPAPAGCGLAGPAATPWLHARGLPAPESPFACASANGVTVMRRPGATPRFSLHGDVGAIATSARADALAWRREELLAGVPVVYPQTSEHFVPPMCNLDRLGGVAYDKGCYTGQEIVARLHFLGTLKRRMFRIDSADDPGGPGTGVYDRAGDGQAVGEIVDAVALDGGGFAASVVLQVAHAQSSTLRGGSPDGVALSAPSEFPGAA